MCKVVLVLVWLKEVKEVVVVTVETDCHLAPEMVVVTVVMDCRQCLERLVSKVVELGWMDKHLKQVTCPSSSHSNNKQMCHRTYRDLRARQTWMQVVKEVRCRDVNKEVSPECKDRDQHGLVRNGFPNNKRLRNRIRKRVCQVMVVRVCLVDQGLEIFQT